MDSQAPAEAHGNNCALRVLDQQGLDVSLERGGLYMGAVACDSRLKAMTLTPGVFCRTLLITPLGAYSWHEPTISEVEMLKWP